VATQDRLPKPGTYSLSYLAVVVEPKHAHRLLEMIIDHGVVHALVDIVERLGGDRLARQGIQRDVRRCEEGRQVYTKPAQRRG
jgi:hypothetical protein